LHDVTGVGPASDEPTGSEGSVPIETTSIDRVADGVGHPLDPRYITLRRRSGWIRAGVQSLMLLAVVGAALTLGPLPIGSLWMLLVIWGVASTGLMWLSQAWPKIAYRHASYRVDADGIEIRRGVIWRVVMNVPRSRVQHTDVSQGPWERSLALGTLAIYTAGTHHAMVALPGLAHERALRIREHLLPRSAHDVV
jgi:uncharacterized protein